MANTLTAILPTIYEALDQVSRELVGFIPAVARDSNAERAAKDQTVTYHVVPAITAEDVTPGNTPADSGDQTFGAETLTISKSRVAPIRWTGEEQRALTNGDRPQGQNIMRDQFAQAFRALVNEVEADLADLYKGASRAYGTAGTAPFGTAGDLTDASNAFKILDDNGAPRGDRHLVLGTAAMANLRGKQNVLFKVNEAGTDQLLRNGVLGRLMGFDIHDSAQVKDHTKGTGSGYLVNNASNEVAGQTTITVDTGSGTIVAGDVVTFAGTTHKYVVKTALSGGDFVLNKPGLLVTEADNDAVTVGNNYSANLAFSRNAIHLVTRTPAMPAGGDDADDVTDIIDPVSGLAFQLAVYRQYRRIKYEVGLAWGVKMAKSEHAAILLG
jgi:hypothetical protein